MCRKSGVKIKHYFNNKSNGKKIALNAMTESVKSLSALTTNVRRRALKRVVRKRTLHKKKRELKCSLKHTLDIYSITVRKVSEKHPNEISKRSVIFSAMLAQERFRHAEHLLAYISSDILLLLSVWL